MFFPHWKQERIKDLKGGGNICAGERRVEKCLQAKKKHEEVGRGEMGMPGLEDSHLEKARGLQDRQGEEFNCGKAYELIKHRGQSKGRRWALGRRFILQHSGSTGLP